MVGQLAGRAQLHIWGGPALALLSLALLMRGLNVW
jgi:hypothetical protein